MSLTDLTPAAALIHPGALCESESVGPRTRVWAFVHILPGAVIGADCNVCDHAYIEGGVVIGDRVTVKNRVTIFDGVTIDDDVFLGPSMTFTNDLNPRAHLKKGPEALSRTHIERGATLGAGVIVVCGTTIGRYAFVAAGAVVTKSVPAHAFMVGNPARAIGWACWCGERLSDHLTCVCGRRYERVDNDLREVQP